MNRFEKKCLIASSGGHLLLGLILLIGPGFLSARHAAEEAPVIEFLPMITTDSAASGGGDPKGGVPPPVAEPPKPAPARPVSLPPPPPSPSRPVPDQINKIEEGTPPLHHTESVDAPKPPKHRIEVNMTPVIRGAEVQTAERNRKEREAQQAAQQQRIVSAVTRAASNLAGNFSGETKITLKGPGGGGVPYGNWLSAIKRIYTEAWILPDGIKDDSATVKATITIARNGEVIATSIINYSGNALVDHSVEATLKRITNAAPLPDGAKEDQRTVTITFNVKAKQELG